MLQIQNMPLPVEGFPAQLEKRAAKLLGNRPGQIQSLVLVRLATDD